jgi:hypothetical protein
MTARLVAIVALAMSLAAPALASTVAQGADPIGAMLDQAPLPEDEEQAETAPPAATPAPPAAYRPSAPAASPTPYRSPYIPTTPQPYRPPATPGLPAAPLPYQAPARAPMRAYSPRPPVTTPVHIDEIGRSPESAPTYTDLDYEARLRASFASAQGMKGQLDGGWRLSAAGGDGLYELQFADNGAGLVEGVWRDLRRPGAIEGAGFVTDISRVGTELRFRLGPQGLREPPSAVLTSTPGGGWNGELNENGQRRGVRLQRD